MPEAAIVVRALTADDVDAYRTLRLAGLRQHPHAFGASHEDEAQLTPADWLARVQRGTALGAFRGAELVGTATLIVEAGSKRRHRGQLVGMYVAPQARGLGVGQALVKAVLALARGRVETVQLAVGIGNAPAIALYLACGFRPYAVDRDALAIAGERVDDILMDCRP